MNFFRNIYEIFIREIMKILKDINLISVFLLAPLAYPLLYGATYMLKVEEDVPVAYIDEDKSALSREILRSFDASQNIKLDHTLNDRSEVKSDLINEYSQSVIIIPENFSYNIKRGKQATVNLIAPAGRLLVTSDIGFPFSQIVSTFSGKIAASHLAKRGVPIFSNPALATPIKLDFQYLGNPYLAYGDLILPFLLVIIISQLVIIGVAAATAKEFSLNKWKDLFAISTNYPAIIIGKWLAYMAIFFFFLLILVTILVPMYNINVTKNLSDMFFCAVLGITSSALFGMFIGSYFRHRITVFAVLGFTTYPFLMLSGYAWPWEQIPTIMQYIAMFLPITPFSKTLFSITQMGNSLAIVTPEIRLMLAQIIFYGGLCIYRFRRLHLSPKPSNAFRRWLTSLPR